MQQISFSDSLKILILGLGWTGQFLQDLFVEQNIAYAATTRDGRNGTIPWSLTASPDVSPLPWANTVLITFPVLSADTMHQLIEKYTAEKGPTNWIILSSTRVYSADPSNRHTPLDPSKDNGRLPAEYEVIKNNGTVLHLSGLWGAQRQPKNWVGRFNKPEALKGKILTRQLHLVHGKDVARAILAVHQNFKSGERWIITDRTAYDWLKLFLVWGSQEQLDIINELRKNDPECGKAIGSHGTLKDIVEKGGVKPRLDSDEFWDTFGLEPKVFLDVV